MGFELGFRRGRHRVIGRGEQDAPPLPVEEQDLLDTFDLIYRALCAALYNYVPMSGHPGGSISSGRIAAALVFRGMDYDLARPGRDDADVLCYAAGHKALGLYALWALRNEIARVGAPSLLPQDERRQLRLEDLLGFRRNPISWTPLFARLESRALDGHPTPATPFVPLATGASGVGLASAVGLALGARDFYGDEAPRVHVLEGEGGLTTGRASEALAAAATARLDNLVLHIDWNQASIDSNGVCRVGNRPGDYVQWDPVELCMLHDWNAIEVLDGRSFPQLLAAQRAAREFETGQPTAVIYRTIKGWRYGIEGRASHGAGHGLCSEGFFDAMRPLLDRYRESLPRCEDPDERRCGLEDGERVMEECFWDALAVVRSAIERERGMTSVLAADLAASQRRLERLRRGPRPGAPRVEEVWSLASRAADGPPSELVPARGSACTLREQLGRVLDHYNRASGGALMVAAADLLDSTSVRFATSGFDPGYFDAVRSPGSRALSIGGICEDAISGVLAGLSAFGRHVGVASSYAAFLAPLAHISARLHAIGDDARGEAEGAPRRPLLLVNAHAGLETGEDGATHADPQALQLLQENFPPGALVTLTPWEPAEVWPLIGAALARRPSIVAPFVTRPPAPVPDRERLGLVPAAHATRGVYELRPIDGETQGTVVLQGSAVTLEFVEQVLPRLERDGIRLHVYYVASPELFDALPPAERELVFPEARAREAIGITGFTLPTMYRWVTSSSGRAATLHPFRRGHYPGSGRPAKVLEQAGLDADSQYEAVRRYVSRGVVV